MTYEKQMEKKDRYAMDISRCSSDMDMVTMVGWVEEKPNIFIDFHEDVGPGRLQCFNGDSLLQWLDMPSNTFAKWVAKPGIKMDEVGHGGAPDPTYKYVKLYTGEFLIKDSLLEKLINGVKYPVILDATYISTERIGNLKGIFGIGDLHGQDPGYRVYKLTTSTPLEEMVKPKKKKEKKEKKKLSAAAKNRLIKKYKKLMYDLVEHGSVGQFQNVASKYLKLASDIDVQRYLIEFLWLSFTINIEDQTLDEFIDEIKPYTSALLDEEELNTERYKQMIAIEWCIGLLNSESVHEVAAIKDKITQTFKDNDIGFPPGYLVIERCVRNSEYNEKNIRDIYRVFKPDATTDDLRKIFIALVYRSRVWHGKKLLIQLEKWGYRDDRDYYVYINNYDAIEENTFKLMVGFYNLLFDVPLEDVLQGALLIDENEGSDEDDI